MAAIDYPDYLPIPQQQGYSVRRSPGFIESDPRDGGFYVVKTTDDIWAEYNFNWLVSNGQAVMLMNFFKFDLDNGLRPFRMKLKIDGEYIEQECRFRAGGIPQQTDERGNMQTFSATVFTRKIDTSYNADDYAMLRWFAERSPNGDPFTGMDILDHAINVSAPEA